MVDRSVARGRESGILVGTRVLTTPNYWLEPTPLTRALSFGVHFGTLHVRQARTGLRIDVGRKLRLRISDQRR